MQHNARLACAAMHLDSDTGQVTTAASCCCAVSIVIGCMHQLAAIPVSQTVLEVKSPLCQNTMSFERCGTCVEAIILISSFSAGITMLPWGSR